MKTIAPLFALLLLTLAVSFDSNAGPSKSTTTATSVADWDTGGDWTNGTPDETKDDIIIAHDAASAAGLGFASGVDLLVKSGNTLTINGDTEFSNGSVVEIEDGATMIINGALNNANNSNGITIDGTLTVVGAFTGGNGSTVTGGGTLSATTISTTGSGTTFGDPDNCTGGCTATPGGGVLPVDLITFFHDVPTNSLQWSTASEMNNDFFNVMGSNNGNDFELVATVLGAGTTSEYTAYSFDIEVSQEFEYYQLVQVDFDGTQTVYNSIHVASKQKVLSLTAYPNPSVDGNITLNITDNAVTDFQIRDAFGRLVLNRNLNPNGDTLSEMVRGLDAGIYTVIAQSPQDTYTTMAIVK